MPVVTLTRVVASGRDHPAGRAEVAVRFEEPLEHGRCAVPDHAGVQGDHGLCLAPVVRLRPRLLLRLQQQRLVDVRRRSGLGVRRGPEAEPARRRRSQCKRQADEGLEQQGSSHCELLVSQSRDAASIASVTQSTYVRQGE